MDNQSRLAAFKASISSNLLAQDDFIDWDAVERRLDLEAANIEHLQSFIDAEDLSSRALASELRAHPGLYEILLDLIAFNSSGAQVEKWGLPQSIDASSTRTRWVAEQLTYVGLNKVLDGRPSARSLLRVAEVYKDSFRRRFRSGRKLEDRVWLLVSRALNEANETAEERISINANAIADPNLRRSLTYVIAVGKRPIVGIATVFQNQSGGRQQRDLSATYPALQDRLDAIGVSLVLIADGQGLREASDRTLNALFEGVRYPMTLMGAAEGELARAILDSSVRDAPETYDQAALNQIIQDALRVRLSVAAGELPIKEDQARLALAYYVNSRRRAALTLSVASDTITWANAEWVRRARELRARFDVPAALELFRDLMGLKSRKKGAATDSSWVDFVAPDVPPFAQSLHVTANRASLSAERAREIGHRSMEQAPGSPVAMYLTADSLSDQQVQAHRKEQIFLPTNVIVVSAALLEQMASDRRPSDRLMDAMLAQSDLTKVSPFILNNATPARMFYGRESEAATVLSTVATNSVAILGSRRIGKTSLIRRLQSELEEAHFQPFFGDCQIVRTWADFSELARKNWGVKVPRTFRPSHLAGLVDQLSAKGDGQVIIILDEIDQLLDWDQTHDEDSVPEAFFRACRSISQEGAAQFVFSGERRIANRLWDPQSPHWNFCREVQLRQLDLSDATALLVEPLRAMNIEIDAPADFEAEAWKRTSGHPQIVQFLGDRLVRVLDGRSDRRNLTLSVEEIVQVTETFEYAEHYLNTYWGQATRFEKSVSEIIAQKPISAGELLTAIHQTAAEADSDDLFAALRILQLYGIVFEDEGLLKLRAEWFSDALAHFSA